MSIMGHKQRKADCLGLNKDSSRTKTEDYRN